MQKANVFGKIIPLEEHLAKLNKIWFSELPDDHTFNTSEDTPPQAVFRRHEIPIADYLMSFQDALRQEFLDEWGSLENFHKYGDNSKAKDDHSTIKIIDNEKIDISFVETIRTKAKTLDLSKDEDETVPNADGWKSLVFKYKNAVANFENNMPEDVRESKFPTSNLILKELGEDCPIATYSYLAPQTQLHRHTGVENRTGEFIRIHIPLIVPEGDIFFECNDDEVRWDDIFAFDNQLVHSAHNLTDEGRLIYLIDVRRTRAGLPPGQPWNSNRQRATSSIYIRQTK